MVVDIMILNMFISIGNHISKNYIHHNHKINGQSDIISVIHNGLHVMNNLIKHHVIKSKNIILILWEQDNIFIKENHH